MGATLVGVRMPPNELARLDDWISGQPKPQPTRPEAIRRLVADRLEPAAPASAEGDK